MSRRSWHDERRDGNRRVVPPCSSNRELFEYYLRKKEVKEQSSVHGEHRNRPSDERTHSSGSSTHRSKRPERRSSGFEDDHCVPSKQRRKDSHGNIIKSEENGTNHRSSSRRKSEQNADKDKVTPNTMLSTSSAHKEEETKMESAPAARTPVEQDTDADFLFEEYLGLDEDNVNVEAMCASAMMLADSEEVIDDFLECKEEITDSYSPPSKENSRNQNGSLAVEKSIEEIKLEDPTANAKSENLYKGSAFSGNVGTSPIGHRDRRTCAYGPALAFFAQNRRDTNTRTTATTNGHRHESARAGPNQSGNVSYFEEPVTVDVLHNRERSPSSDRRYSKSSTRIVYR